MDTAIWDKIVEPSPAIVDSVEEIILQETVTKGTSRLAVFIVKKITQCGVLIALVENKNRSLPR